MTVTVVQERLPDNLAYGLKAGDLYETEKVVTGGGFSFKNRRWKRPRKRFVGTLKNMSLADREGWFGFMKTVAFGQANNFILLDRTDYCSQAPQGLPPVISATDQILVGLATTDGATGVAPAIGDGATLQFRLCKQYFSPSNAIRYCRLINFPVPSGTLIGSLTASIKIGIAGVDTPSGGHWSIDAETGIVTFITPPGIGAALTAGFFFYVPVEFDEDYYALSQDQPTLSSIDQISLTEVRVS